jgi:DNA mismatch repair protein MutS2
LKVFPANIPEVFEFDKILLEIQKHCISKMGKAYIKNVRLLNNCDKINTLLQQTHEFKSIVTNGEAFPTQDYIDLTRELNLLRIDNGVLQEHDFLNIKTVCSVIESIFNFFKLRDKQYPQLFELLTLTTHEPLIAKEIDAIIDLDGTVRTSASRDLANIRKDLQKARAEVDKLYNHLINKYRKLGYLHEEATESVRNERRVIVIESSYKTQMKGIHHDVSSTGKATFIEPSEAIESNNKVMNLEHAERQEVIRLLRALSAKLRIYFPIVNDHQRLLAVYDYTRAKALLAVDMNACYPTITNERIIHLNKAYHPLLFLQNKTASKTTIPFTFELNSNKHLLIISGPNAGGKTICMKATGLIMMMMHAGFLVPVHESSVLGIFNHLMVDMGDTQSMEFELSTYSARLRNMNHFLKRAHKDTLLLIDEFGTGTDPLLGGALAEAILEEFHAQKCFGVVTTHYLNLKLVTEKLSGVLNGAMSYDPEHLKPLFELKVGKPGSSFTFAVAEKIGLPKAIIDRAKSLSDDSSIRMDELLNGLENELLRAREKGEDLAIKETALAEQTEKYKRLADENKNTDFKDVIKKQNHRLKQLENLEERVIRMSKGFLRGKGNAKLNVVNQFVKTINFDEEVMSAKELARKEAAEAKAVLQVIQIGDVVRVRGSMISGSVIEIIDKKIHIQFGAIRTIADLKNVELIA